MVDSALIGASSAVPQLKQSNDLRSTAWTVLDGLGLRTSWTLK
jgi:hypothetical protein